MRTSLLAASFVLYFNASLALPGERRQATNSTWSGPLANGGSAWKHAFAKAKEVVSKMTLEEKVNITTGIGSSSTCAGNTGAVPRLNIPTFCLQDGPAGVRPADFASQFPAQVTVAATWDRDLIYDRAVAIADEFRGKGVHVALAPVTGGPLGRSPLGGRNWEGFSADPYLSSIGSYITVKGIQDRGVVATSKHYSLYEQETYRNQKLLPPRYNGTYHPLPISSDVDDVGHLPRNIPVVVCRGFRAGTGSIMCSYNRVNGSHGCEDDVTLNQVLKGELDYQGYVMSDWYAHWTNEGAALGGMDMTMPGTGFWGADLVALVKNGTDKGFPSLQYNTSGIGSQTYLALNPGNTNVNVQADHYKLIRKIGEESATLLKNTRTHGGGIPLKKSKCTADHANNGTSSIGGGSGAAYAPYIVTPLEGIQSRTSANETQVNWLLNDWDLGTAKTSAKIADTSIVFTYAYQTESRDRDNLTAWSNGDNLIKTVAAECNNTIVVVHSGQQILMDDWIEHPNITAVIFAYYPGQETGNAIASILFGEVNPSGKVSPKTSFLPFTIAKSASDYPPNGIFTENVTDPHIVFEEGNLIDYRWFDAKNITPRFEFGFGLSLTTFNYSNLKIRSTPGNPIDGIQLTKEPFDGSGTLYDIAYTVTATVKNTGSINGCEVTQLYLSYPSTQTSQPLRSLRGFDKLCLNRGESKTTSFKLRQKDYAVWDVVRQTWTIPKGEFTVHVGSSSRVLPLKSMFNV
ncbi:glycoside hydrolase family 3 protein [Rhizoctonia solani]|uniref:Probable beta-glucosidase G n=1 Tax=Rhizoctonia solani TaxID=456999 RepID=A0A8H8NYR5_9AGAM|nr:glycoside hydrolase family 3 protein [Rhizoctonia solani]QRW20796.1 glycoside hydrolase family 3 protein [Rhizoctonia solani]